MFCPKCGTKNPENGKFCRSCGTDIGDVSQALTGKLPLNLAGQKLSKKQAQKLRRQDPNELFADSVKSTISGIGFLIISVALLVTGVAGGRVWWWAMLFPAFAMISKGVSDYLKMKRLEDKGAFSFSGENSHQLDQSPIRGDLPASQTDYISPNNRTGYQTGDLAPPSVTEQTTRLLEMDSEGQTMTLPKKDD